MSMDGLSLYSAMNELNKRLAGGKIDKIQQTDKEELLLMVRSLGQTYRLLINASAADNRVQLTELKKQAPSEAPMFCMLLRKRIAGGKIVRFEQERLDRVLKISIETYNDLGDLSASGWAAYNRIDMFLMVPTTAIGQASTTFVAQNWGAQQPERARKGVRTGILLSLGCMGVCAVGVILLARPLLSIISPSEAVISFGARFLYIITPFYLVISFNQMYAGALRGIGESVVPTVIMLFSFVVFRQIYLYLATTMIADEQLRFVIVALAYPVGWMLCSALEAIAYHRSRLFHPALKKAEA